VDGIGMTDVPVVLTLVHEPGVPLSELRAAIRTELPSMALGELAVIDAVVIVGE
jgi:hypothetical protein